MVIAMAGGGEGRRDASRMLYAASRSRVGAGGGG